MAILRGTTADEDGNVSMEQEAIFGEMLSCAQATRRNGGIVIVQVKRMAQRGTLPAKTVKIPGILVDYVVVDPEQRQTYATDYSPAYAGEFRVPLHALKRLPFDVRKIVARRAAMEITPGAICNLGAGISTGISVVATEENILDRMVLTNEQGFIGGAPLTGVDSGASQNYDAIVDQPYQFDFYDGGGLDIAFLSFAEVDPSGNVNISRFGSTRSSASAASSTSARTPSAWCSAARSHPAASSLRRATASSRSSRKGGIASSSIASSRSATMPRSPSARGARPSS